MKPPATATQWLVTCRPGTSVLVLVVEEPILPAHNAAAVAGDMRACELLMRRLWPERRGRPVEFNLPPMQAATDIVFALGAVTEAVARAELSPEEGQSVAAILEAQRRAHETADLEARLAAMEAKLAANGR